MNARRPLTRSTPPVASIDADASMDDSMAVLAGEGEVGPDDAHGKRVALVATLLAEDEVRAALTGAGFCVDELVKREPYPFEYPSRRIHATAPRA